MDLNASYVFSKEAKVIINGNRVILANRYTGKWLKLSKECYDILVEFLDKKYTVKALLDMLSDEDDVRYFTDIFEKLMSIEVLVTIDYFNIEQKPEIKSVCFNITHRCNLKCRHCSMSAVSKNEIDPLTTDQVKDCIDKIHQLNPRILILTGGEPLLRDDFLEILKYAVEIKKIPVQVMTNGTLINESNVKEICKYIHAIDISIDGIDEKSCSIIRGNGVFEKVMNSIQLLKDNGMNKISLSMVEIKSNMYYMEKFNLLCNQLNVKAIPRMYEPIGRGLSNRNDLSKNIEEYYKEELKYNDETYYSMHPEELSSIELNDGIKICTCKAAVEEITIENNGDIFPCNLLTDIKYEIGNILETKDIIKLLISELCNTYGYKNVCKIQPDIISICKDCKVNLFCHTCLSSVERCNNNKDEFELYCNNRKKFLYKLIWDEVSV